MINIYKSGKYDITLEFDNFGLYNILNAFKKLKNKENATIECECKKIIFKNNSLDNIYNYIEIKKQSITNTSNLSLANAVANGIIRISHIMTKLAPNDRSMNLIAFIICYSPIRMPVILNLQLQI